MATAPKVEPGEPAEWSVLRRPLRDLLWTLGGQEEALYRRGDSVRLGVLDLDQSDRECLRAITLTDDDTLADLASMAIGLICDARISDAGFERIVRSLGGLLGSNDIYLTLADDQVSDCPIIGPSEVVSLCSLRLDVFTVSPLLLRALRMLGVATWGELGDLSERDVLGRLGLTATSFTLVRSIWHLHTMVRGISARIGGGLPEDAYTTFERLVYSFVRLGAKTQRDCMILQGRLGTLGGRKWTLDELGAVLKLTRERVRQVAKKHFEKLLRPVALDTLERYWLGVATALTAAGGVLDASELSLALTSLFSWKDAPVGNASASLAALWPGAEVLWDPPVRVILPTHPCLTCDRAPGMLTAEVALADGRLDVSDVATRLRDRCVRYCEAALSGVPFFSKACVLYLAKERTRLNVDGAALYDDRAWAVRYGRRSALVEAVMLEQKRPMHFSEVHERISRMRPDEETLSERNIHAYLGASPTVLLWDRGTYVHSVLVQRETEFCGLAGSWVPVRYVGLSL